MPFSSEAHITIQSRGTLLLGMWVTLLSETFSISHNDLQRPGDAAPSSCTLHNVPCFVVCAVICLALFSTLVAHLSGSWSNPDFVWAQRL